VVRHLGETHGYTVRPSSREEQFQGIDYHVTNPATGNVRTVEVKADRWSQRTHNAFVETVSNDRTGRPGWVHTCAADYLLYFVEGDDVLYWLDPQKLRDRLPEWTRRADRGDGPIRHAKPVPNGRYNTLGLLVPLAAFEALAEMTESL
jgi:hypothetical protein